MASESLQCKTVVLRVSIHCEGCKKKVKKVLQSVDGVYRCDVDARSNKATVAVTGNVGADALVKRLRRSGKHAEQWPEQPTQPQQQHADTQSSGETKNEAGEREKPGDATEKAGSGDAETNAVEPSNPEASPEEPDTTTGETARPAQDGTKSTEANASADPAAGHGTKEATAEQCEGKQQDREEKPVDPVAVAAAAASGHASHASSHLAPPLLLQQQQPVRVMSYSVARPGTSAAYYAAAPAALPLQPSYPPCHHHYSQPSPYSCYHHCHWTPQTSAVAASPARDSYGDLFSDDNANSCSLM